MVYSLLLLFIVVISTKFVLISCHEGHYDGILLLHGSGTTNPSKCYWTILEQFQEQSPIPIHATYRGIGSTNGMKEFAYPFINNTVDAGLYPNFFGSGDIPITNEIYNQINNSTFNRSNQFVHIPVLAGTISFFHNAPSITNLNLTACLLSLIYTQQITTWDHEQILNINPEMKNQIDIIQGLPITSIHRTEGSSSTHAATNYMNTACSDTRVAFPKELTGELPDWPPASDTFRNCSGSAGVTECILETNGTIGYIDTGHGLHAGLYEVRLSREDTADGFFHSQEGAPIIDAISADLLPSSPTADFSNVSFLNIGSSTTWPLILMTYIYVRTDLSSFMDNPYEQSLLIAYLRTFFRDEYMEQCNEKFGFTTMNQISSMKAYGEAAIDLIEQSLLPNATTWIFESSTNPIVGSTPYVLSSKRREIIDENIKDLTSMITDLESNVNELMTLSSTGSIDTDTKTKVQFLQGEVEKLFTELNTLRAEVTSESRTSSTFGSSSSSPFTNQDETQIKAALVLSCLSFIFWCMWICVYVMRYVIKA